MSDSTIADLFDEIETNPRPGFEAELLGELLEASLDVDEQPAEVQLLPVAGSGEPRGGRVRTLLIAAAVVVLIAGIALLWTRDGDITREEEGVGVADQPLSDDPVAAAFLADVAEINQRRDDQLNAIIGPVLFDDPDGPARSPEQRMVDFSDAYPAMSSVLRDWAAELEALDAPAGFRTELALFVEGLEERDRNFGAVDEAARAGDLDEAFSLFGESDAARASYGAAFGQEFRATLPEGFAPAADVVAGTEPLSAVEEQYLNELSDASNIFSAAVTRFQQSIGQSVPTENAFFAALEEAGVGTPWPDALEYVAGLTAPSRFESDHAILLSRLAILAEADQAIAAAVADRDLELFQVRDYQLSRAADELTAAVPTAVAAAFSGLVPSWVEDPPDDAFLGGYGVQLHEQLKGTAATLRIDVDIPRFGRPTVGHYLVWGPLVTDEIRAAVVAVISPEIADDLVRRRSVLAVLEPPDAVSGDHQLILEFLDDSIARHRELAEAADAGDIAAMDELIAVAAPRFCDLVAGVSSTIDPAARVLTGTDGGAQCSAG